MPCESMCWASQGSAAVAEPGKKHAITMPRSYQDERASFGAYENIDVVAVWHQAGGKEPSRREHRGL